MIQKVAALRVGDPMKEDTQMGPMARLDLRDELHRQVTDSIAQGAQALLGCEPVAGEGAYYLPSILDHVTPQRAPITRSCSALWPPSSARTTNRTP